MLMHLVIVGALLVVIGCILWAGFLFWTVQKGKSVPRSTEWNKANGTIGNAVKWYFKDMGTAIAELPCLLFRRHKKVNEVLREQMQKSSVTKPVVVKKPPVITADTLKKTAEALKKTAVREDVWVKCGFPSAQAIQKHNSLYVVPTDEKVFFSSDIRVEKPEEIGKILAKRFEQFIQYHTDEAAESDVPEASQADTEKLADASSKVPAGKRVVKEDADFVRLKRALTTDPEAAPAHEPTAVVRQEEIPQIPPLEETPEFTLHSHGRQLAEFEKKTLDLHEENLRREQALVTGKIALLKKRENEEVPAQVSYMKAVINSKREVAAYAQKSGISIPDLIDRSVALPEARVRQEIEEIAS